MSSGAPTYNQWFPPLFVDLTNEFVTRGGLSEPFPNDSVQNALWHANGIAQAAAEYLLQGGDDSSSLQHVNGIDDSSSSPTSSATQPHAAAITVNSPTNAATTALLERTRYELLNGRDFWICTRCVIGIPSIKNPCAKCRRMISFVPLDIKEFEEFVRNQKERNRKKKSYEWQPEWQQKETELQEEWYEEGDGVRQQDL